MFLANPSVLLAVIALTACQPSSGAQYTAINGPASDDSETLDLTLLPEGFPILGEIQSASAPAGCALSKATRQGAHAGTSYDDRYVFTARAEGDYQVGINGELRTVRQTQIADAGENIIRYFKTVDGNEVEVQLAYAKTEDGLKGTVGRVKAWDAGLPLMCAYNRIEITGECDL